MFATLIRRAVEGSRAPLARGGPYKLKKVWPPDFTQLSKADQLRFEKRYKRRLRLMGARPRWNKMLKLAQLVSITSIVIYGFLFMKDAQTGEEPFGDFRKWFWGQFGIDYEPAKGKSGRPLEASPAQAGKVV